MRKCSECNENAAVLFIQDMNDKTKVRGICLKCAKKLNIPGIDSILANAGIDEDNIDYTTQQMNSISEVMQEQLDNEDRIPMNELFDKVVSTDEFKNIGKNIENIFSNMKDNGQINDVNSFMQQVNNASKELANLFKNYDKNEENGKEKENESSDKKDNIPNKEDVVVIDEKEIVKLDNENKKEKNNDDQKDDDGLIDISTLEKEMKKMFGGKNGGIFEISLSSPNSGIFDGIKDLFSQGDVDGYTEDVRDTKKKNKNIKNIEKFSTNLTELAKNNEVDPVIGREKEIERVIQILNRRTKNNPVLIGEPGVGKTAIAEGLAYKIANGDVPQKLLDYEVMQLDISAIVAGTQFRGQFETRLNNIIDEAKRHGKIILVIDEIHSIIGAGDNHGTMDAANILKPALARADIQIIGATTINEYKKHIEKDKALERRLQSVLVEEPSIEDTIKIIKGLKEYYENYHKIILTDDVIETAVKLSSRYITDRYLPDKAIDIIDELGSKVNLKNDIIYKIESIKQSIQTLEKKQEEANANSDYEKATSYKSQELNLEKELEDLKSKEYIKVTTQQVAEVIEQWTKIPVKEISFEETQRLLNLENRLKQSVVGQDEAIELISKAIRRNRAGISAVKKPSSFIFVGPTGVGKTQLVKSLAKDIFGSEDSIIRVDMSEYMEKHSVSKLVGAPPGYVGFDDGGQLTDKVKRRPYSIILLDEIEKAHPDVFNMLLQILDDGRLTDSQGNVIHFENTIVIMTSNIGTTFKNKSLGFSSNEDEKESQRVNEALKENFKPEFLNRVDEIVIFNRLSKQNLRDIVDILINDLQNVVKDKGIKIGISDEVKDFIVEKGYDEKYGARPLRRVIQKYIEDEIADIFITSDITKINMLTLQLLNKKIMVEKN